MTAVKPHCLYFCPNGISEPLVRSQVLAYMNGLSQDYRFTLVTVERVDDASAAVVDLPPGVQWIPVRTSGGRNLGSFLTVMRMLRAGLKASQRENTQILHARSYMPAFVAMTTGFVRKIPFIFDMRALWPEELITAGRLKRGSVIHRIIVVSERLSLRRAAAVVSLTVAGAHHIVRTNPDLLLEKKLTVIPTCADLRCFQPGQAEEAREEIFGCVGSVLSGWFRIQWLANFIRCAMRSYPGARFEIVTRDDPGEVTHQLQQHGAPLEAVSVFAAEAPDVPAIIRHHAASVLFYEGGATSELGRCPTRLGEVLACGVPVLVNEGVGDVAEIVTRERIGVVVGGGEGADMEAALEALSRLRADPELAGRCRRAAERLFSLDQGVEAYRRIYQSLLRERGQAGSLEANDATRREA
jgi:glycosyltransferase involved in cell wall biosynthesis